MNFSFPSLQLLCAKNLCKLLNNATELSKLPPAWPGKILELLHQVPERFMVRCLNLSFCVGLTNEDIKYLPYFNQIEELDLSSTENLSGQALACIAKLPKLRSLKLNQCPHANVGLYYLKGHPSLEHLELDFCEIEDPVLSEFISQLNVNSLSLKCNRFTDEGADRFQQLSQLVSLDLSWNPNITDKTVRVLSRLPLLKNLKINFCRSFTIDALSELQKKSPDVNIEGISTLQNSQPICTFIKKKKQSNPFKKKKNCRR